MRSLLITAGIVLLAAGLFWPWLSRLPFGTLPGDIQINRPAFRFYVPLGSSILLSLVLSLLLTLLAWFWRR